MKNSLFSILCYLFIFSNCQSETEGKRIYTDRCMNCHMDNGNGVANLIPPLNEEKFISFRKQLVCKVENGVLEDSAMIMPAYHQLSDIQKANVLNYIIHLKSYKVKLYTEEEIAESLSKCNE